MVESMGAKEGCLYSISAHEFRPQISVDFIFASLKRLQTTMDLCEKVLKIEEARLLISTMIQVKLGWGECWCFQYYHHFCYPKLKTKPGNFPHPGFPQRLVSGAQASEPVLYSGYQVHLEQGKVARMKALKITYRRQVLMLQDCQLFQNGARKSGKGWNPAI